MLSSRCASNLGTLQKKTMDSPLRALLFVTCVIAPTLSECPFGTLRYEPEGGGKVQCYIVMKYHEIRFITMMLWREAFNTTEWHNRNTVEGHGWSLKNREKIYWEMDTVDSYPDALRMCAMIGELDPEAIIPDPQQPWNADIIKNMMLGSTGGTTVTPMIKMPNFPVEWTTIPGDDIHFRLPTPNTVEHLRWIQQNILFDGYYWLEKIPAWLNKTLYHDRGVMWLGIKKSTSPLRKNRNVRPRDHRNLYRDKPGECGLLYKPMKWTLGRVSTPGADKETTLPKTKNESGLYWVQCIDDWVEDQYPYYEFKATKAGKPQKYGKKDSGHHYPGWHVVACEFDEPEDCIQRLENETCYISEKHTGNFTCVLAGKYEILRQPHQRFGKKCRDNETDGMTIPCPKRLQYQCRQDCRLSQWQNAYGCLMPANEDDNITFYPCIAGDGEGLQFQVRRQVAEARFGGADQCHTKRMQRKIGCTCSGQQIRAYLWVLLSCVTAAHVGEKMTALLECQ